MKKTLLALTIFLFAFAGAASAIELATGGIGIKYTDYTFSDFDYINSYGGQGPNPHPDQFDPITGAYQPSGNVWGIFAMTTVHTLVDSNPENNALSGIPTYANGSDGKYYFGVYGGLTYMSDSGAIPGTARLTTTNYDSTVANESYLKVYELDAAFATSYDQDWLAGPNVAGAGQFGTFGQNIINNGTLWLDAVYSPFTLQYYDGQYQAGELELITFSSSVTGSAEGYLDIIGGSAADLFEKDVFPLGLNAPPGTGADLKAISDLTADYDTISGTWNGAWTNTSQDPITGVVVPEPSTIILLGFGLLGIAGARYRKSKKS